MSLSDTQNRTTRPVDHAETLLTRSFAKFDNTALGMACGVVSGLFLFIATIFLVIKGGEHVGANLSLLAQFLPGFTVTVVGSFIGLGYGFVIGFIGGWLFAFLHNVTMAIYLFVLQFMTNIPAITDYIDPDHSHP
jgi:hypothetical protein